MRWKLPGFLFVLAAFSFSAVLMWNSPAPAQGVDALRFVTEQYPPYNFEENGELKGISIDVLLAALDVLGSSQGKDDIRLLPWAKGYDLALHKKNVALFATTRTEERENKFKWAGPIAPTRISLVAKKGSGVSVAAPGDIAAKGYTVGVIRDDVGQQLLQSAGVPDKHLDAVADALFNIKKLDRGRIDAWAYEENVAMWLIKSNGFDASAFEPIHELKSGELYYAFHKDTPDAIVDSLQKAIDQVKASGKHDEIVSSYR